MPVAGEFVSVECFRMVCSIVRCCSVVERRGRKRGELRGG